MRPVLLALALAGCGESTSFYMHGGALMRTDCALVLGVRVDCHTEAVR